MVVISARVDVSTVVVGGAVVVVSAGEVISVAVVESSVEVLSAVKVVSSVESVGHVEIVSAVVGSPMNVEGKHHPHEDQLVQWVHLCVNCDCGSDQHEYGHVEYGQSVVATGATNASKK